MSQHLKPIGQTDDETPFVNSQIEEDTVEQLQIQYGRMIQLARGLERALRTIARYDEESIWDDDRDDAANAILEIARKALGEKT